VKLLTLPSLTMPLLARELIEQAARRRTYVLRTLYALAVVGLFVVLLVGALDATSAGTLAALGVGKIAFDGLLAAQLVAIYVVVPLMAAGAIAREKEQRSLELLLITGLTPRQIVVQKLLGRSIPVIGFIVLAVPPTALAYTFGGLSPERLALTAVALVVTTLEVAALTLVLSAHSRTTNEALARSYLCIVLVPAAIALVGSILGVMLWPLAVVPGVLMLGLVPWLVTFELGLAGGRLLLVVLTCILGGLLWTAGLVRRAETYLVSRLYVPKPRRRGGIFRAFQPSALNMLRSRRERLVGRGGPPGDEPITWREVTRTAIGTRRGFTGSCILFGLFVVVLGLFSLAVVEAPRRGNTPPAAWITTVLWLIAVPAVALPSVGGVAIERAHRTLDVLLTTPLTGADIVHQKSRWAGRMTGFMFVLLAMPLVVQIVWYVDWMIARPARSWAMDDAGMLVYLAAAAMSAPVFLTAVSWVARLIGLRVRARDRATVVTVAVLLTWWVGPLWLFGEFRAWEHWGGYLSMVSPLSAMAGALWLARQHFEAGVATGVCAGLVFNAGVAFLARQLCLRNADRYLGRVAAGPVHRATAGAAAGG
jgi:ABC-type transport system involved in multi-copper enzyme maturation permease subunit